MQSKKLMKWGILGVLAAMSMGVVGCNSGGHVDPYVPIWYDVYGNYCVSGSPEPGCNFYRNGDKIIDVEDPYFNSSYNLQYGWWQYYDSYGYSQDYIGWGWLSPDNVLYDDYGRALNEDGSTEDRDVIAGVAQQEKANVEGAGKQFAARYALAEATGIKVARTLNDWAKLGKSRARTEQDIADFSKRLGVDMNKVTVALDKAQGGDKTELNNTMADLANFWGTSPETSKEILKNAYKDYLKDYDLQ